MKELDSAKLLSASLKLSETRSTEIVDKLRRELTAKFDSIQLVEGPEGLQGLTGRKGDSGDRGFIGATGSRGDQGKQGASGIQGEQGVQGNEGEQGIQGEQGVQGDKGEQGIQGEQGDIGAQGEQGVQGVQGVRGEKGSLGDKGDLGLSGKDGIDGVDGKSGIDGTDGIAGKDGRGGKDGVDGKDGARGKAGIRGEKGVKGDSGSDANVAPLEKKFQQLTQTVETKISRIAYGAAMGTSAGSGEVNLKHLDDVDYNSITSATNGQVLTYSQTLNKWQANTASGSSSGSSTEAALGNTNLAITNVKSGLTTTNTALRLLINNRLQVANAVALYTTKAGPTTSGLLAHTGRATISTNLTVSGNTTLTQLILSSVLSPTYGGTGLSSVVSNGILYGANSSILGYLTGTSGQILQIGSSGVPQFDTLDGGAF